MSPSENWKSPEAIENLANSLFEQVEAAIARSEDGSISDDAVQKLMTAAVKLYRRKSVAEGRDLLPVISPQALTATEAIHAACELIRSVDLNPFDLALWFSRPRHQGRTES